MSFGWQPYGENEMFGQWGKRTGTHTHTHTHTHHFTPTATHTGTRQTPWTLILALTRLARHGMTRYSITYSGSILTVYGKVRGGWELIFQVTLPDLPSLPISVQCVRQ